MLEIFLALTQDIPDFSKLHIKYKHKHKTITSFSEAYMR